MTDDQDAIDRECVQQVFGLTGGELMDKPWIVKDAIPGEDAREWTFHYWYEFPPEYAEREYDYTAHNYRTVVRDNMFGGPPEMVFDETGTPWDRVAVFMSSGETQCDNPTPAPCEYCGAQEGQKHGYIYLGDGWAEVVYQEREPVDIDE